jgi:predicted O-methyltransferase YrrM
MLSDALSLMFIRDLLKKSLLAAARTHSGRRAVSFVVRNMTEVQPAKQLPPDSVFEAPNVLDHLLRYDPHRGEYRHVDGSVDYSSTELEVCRLWYWFVRMVKPRRILETGTYHGFSTCFLAAGLKDAGIDGSVITVDPARIAHLWDGTNLQPYIQWLPLRSDQVGLDVLGADLFDVLVIDSEHTYRTSMSELSRFEPLVKPGGYILFHDSLFHDGVGHTVATLYDDPRFEVITFETPRTLSCHTMKEPLSMGFSVARKVANGPRLPIREDLLSMPEHMPYGPLAVIRQHASDRASGGMAGRAGA